tara:strand:+ start:2607 stop:2963 length:357 start_codon:yes stop_codon:yes gene_type:complete
MLVLQDGVKLMLRQIGIFKSNLTIYIRHFMHIAHEDFATKRLAMDLHCALIGIEIAMWDIIGKTVEQPIYNLLGGPVRPHIRVYANGWGHGSPDDIAQEAAELVEQRGFNALKFDPFP